jgi:hypothetical protein
MNKKFQNSTAIMNISNGFIPIEEGLNKYVNCINLDCSEYTAGIMETSKELNSYLFIGTDAYSKFTLFALN